MKKTYIVVQKGVYIQDVMGPFRTHQDALAHAQHRAEIDLDDYHTYEVLLIDRDGTQETFGSFRQRGYIVERQALEEDWRRFPQPIVTVDADYATWRRIDERA